MEKFYKLQVASAICSIKLIGPGGPQEAVVHNLLLQDSLWYSARDPKFYGVLVDNFKKIPSKTYHSFSDLFIKIPPFQIHT